MNDFLDFFKNQKKIWITFVVVFFVVLGLVAWWIGNTPGSPFGYRLD